MNRLDTHVDDLLIRGIDGHGSDVSFEHSAPIFAGVVRPMKSVLRDTKINNVGLAS
jgi:hypothetical protein